MEIKFLYILGSIDMNANLKNDQVTILLTTLPYVLKI